MPYFLMILAIAVLLALACVVIFIILPGQRIPVDRSQYVALGSSYAAGLGLGKRVPGSAVAAGRTVNSYPQKLARMAGLSLVDMSWSGSKSRDILQRGALRQRPQIDAVGADTELVTMTTGGNDVGYGGDLMLLSFRNKNAVWRFLIDALLKNPLPVGQRDFGVVHEGISAAIAQIRRRAPAALIVVVTYPPVLPEHDSCAALRLTAADIALMRPVADKLAAVTRAAASESGAMVLDMATLGVGHDACSSEPWTRGAITDETPFHPSNAGTDAIAGELKKMVMSAKKMETFRHC